MSRTKYKLAKAFRRFIYPYDYNANRANMFYKKWLKTNNARYFKKMQWYIRQEDLERIYVTEISYERFKLLADMHFRGNKNKAAIVLNSVFDLEVPENWLS